MYVGYIINYLCFVCNINVYFLSKRIVVVNECRMTVGYLFYFIYLFFCYRPGD